MRGTHWVTWCHTFELLLVLSHTCICQEVIHGHLGIKVINIRVYNSTVLSLNFGMIDRLVILGVHYLLHVLIEPFLSIFVQILAVFLEFWIVWILLWILSGRGITSYNLVGCIILHGLRNIWHHSPTACLSSWITQLPWLRHLHLRLNCGCLGYVALAIEVCCGIRWNIQHWVASSTGEFLNFPFKVRWSFSLCLQNLLALWRSSLTLISLL